VSANDTGRNYDYGAADTATDDNSNRAATSVRNQVQTSMSRHRVNDMGGSFQQIGQWAFPAALGAFVTVFRVLYQGGRKKLRATIFEALLVAAFTGSVGPLLAYLGMPIDLAYPIAVFVGYVGIDRVSMAIMARMGMQ